MRNGWCRIAGAGLIAASAGTTMAHRAVFEAAKGGPAQVAEFALALTTLVLACAGILMLLHGAKLFTRVDAAQPDAPARPRDFDFGQDTRHGIALAQANRAIERAQARVKSRE